MIHSMTGFGRSQQVNGGYDIAVEIRSVNHRYSDYAIRVPRHYSFLEDKAKAYLQQSVSRGKIDLYISVRKKADDSKTVALNAALAEGYINAMHQMVEQFGVKDDVSAAAVSRFSDVFDITYNEADEEEVWAAVAPALSEAADRFLQMRAKEGAKLAADMVAHNARIRTLLQEIEQRSPQTVAQYRQRIEQRIRELIGDASVDENRLLTETAIYADKLCIDEETVRLGSHLDEFDSIMAQGDAVGRKLDFLLQEMNRETNTIGSKANDLEISKKVVEIKSELEKIREQLQNIE